MESKKPSIYLKKIILNNFAIFSEQTIHFTDSFNSIIGETGSGKSLILDALIIILGGRSDKKFIRPPHKHCQIEAVFQVNDHQVENFFDNIGHPLQDNEIVIKRIIYQDKPSKSFLNFSQCTLNEIEKFTKTYIDFVGQFDNQKLLRSDYQLSLIDHYGTNHHELKEYELLYSKFCSHIQIVDSLKNKSKTKEEKLSFLKYQFDEISKLNPSQENEEELITLKNNFKKIEKIREFSHKILGPLCLNEDFNILSLFKKIIKSIDQNADFISESLQKKANELLETLNDFSFNISGELAVDEVDYNINEIMSKIFSYQKLKSKYNLTSDELKIKQEELFQEIKLLETIDLELLKEEKYLQQLENELLLKANILHKKRVLFAKELEKNLTLKIHELNMEEASIKILIRKLESPNSQGISELSFEAETNKNYGFYPLKDIASGGELSRILLAIRQELASKDSIQVFLFDEIDTGLDGKTALKIGKILNSLSKSSQVIAITHLPQIAHFSDQLILVKKTASQKSLDNKTNAIVHEIIGKEKSKQVKSMSPLQ